MTLQLAWRWLDCLLYAMWHLTVDVAPHHWWLGWWNGLHMYQASMMTWNGLNWCSWAGLDLSHGNRRSNKPYVKQQQQQVRWIEPVTWAETKSPTWLVNQEAERMCTMGVLLVHRGVPPQSLKVENRDIIHRGWDHRIGRVKNLIIRLAEVKHTASESSAPRVENNSVSGGYPHCWVVNDAPQNVSIIY